MSELILSHMDYAKKVAVQTKFKLKLPLETEDAVQAGYEGLVIAARRFQHRLDLDAQFKSYAFYRIRGSVIDESRRMTITHRRGHESGDRVLIMSTDEYRQSSDGSDLPEPKIQLSAKILEPSMSMDIQKSMEPLTDRERYVVVGRAIGLKGWEMANELGVSIMRVSQIAAAGTSKMLVHLQSESFGEYCAN